MRKAKPKLQVHIFTCTHFNRCGNKKQVTAYTTAQALAIMTKEYKWKVEESAIICPSCAANKKSTRLVIKQTIYMLKNAEKRNP